MQDRPEKEVLLDALARFLLEQVRPAITDAGLSFRVLIAANLATIAASEIRGEDEQNAAELARLRALLPEIATSTDPKEATRALNKALADRLKAGAFDSATAHVKQTLLEKLAVSNPRFETVLEIE